MAKMEDTFAVAAVDISALSWTRSALRWLAGVLKHQGESCVVFRVPVVDTLLHSK